MVPARFSLLLCLFVTVLLAGQAPADKAAQQEPSLPIVDYNACPFEGCTFGKWIVNHDFAIFSSWKDDRKPLSTVKKGEVVAGLTGVHITYEPDRIQVLKSIPELRLQAGDIILRYMYRGEGFADIWVRGQWKKEYDCSFITEKNGSGCLRDCPAKVISDGKKEWWVRLKTTQGSIGLGKSGRPIRLYGFTWRRPQVQQSLRPLGVRATPSLLPDKRGNRPSEVLELDLSALRTYEALAAFATYR